MWSEFLTVLISAAFSYLIARYTSQEEFKNNIRKNNILKEEEKLNSLLRPISYIYSMSDNKKNMQDHQLDDKYVSYGGVSKQAKEEIDKIIKNNVKFLDTNLLQIYKEVSEEFEFDEIYTCIPLNLIRSEKIDRYLFDKEKKLINEINKQAEDIEFKMSQ